MISIVFNIFLIFENGFPESLGQMLLASLGLSFFVAVVAFIPAVLGSGVWEALGYRPPIAVLTILGATTGAGLPLWGALEDFPAVDTDDVIVTLVFACSGAAGGLTLGWFRRVFRPDGNR